MFGRDQSKSATIANGNALRIVEFENDPDVQKLTWVQKGSLLLHLNKPLLEQAQAKGRPKTITLVSALMDLGRGDLPACLWQPWSRKLTLLLCRFLLLLCSGRIQTAVHRVHQASGGLPGLRHAQSFVLRIQVQRSGVTAPCSASARASEIGWVSTPPPSCRSLKWRTKLGRIGLSCDSKRQTSSGVRCLRLLPLASLSQLQT